MRNSHRLPILVLLGLACACSGHHIDGQPPSSLEGRTPPVQLDPGTVVTLSLSDAQSKEQVDLAPALAAVSHLSASDFGAKYAPHFAESLGYDPKVAKGLDLIQASPVKLTDAELAVYGQRGFVISEGKHYPSFANGYQTIYMADLPVFVSADSILEAVHRGYDLLLEQIELQLLMGQLRAMLTGMRSKLAAATADQASADADVYLATALGLLENKVASPVRGGDPALIADFFAKASQHQGLGNVVLFGVSRVEDFSQFTPRGHYVDSPELTRYFQAMMWLGRIDFRFIETLSDGSQVFRRRQVEGALRLRDLLDNATHENWAAIDATVEAFVGKADYMTLPQLDSLLNDLGVKAASELANISDTRIAQAIVAGGYGTQKIASHIMYGGLADKSLPLSSSFALMGQRYVVDSHVFSNVVYDRVRHDGYPARMMPDPLDAAFAALGNDQAGTLLADQLGKYGYAPDLASMRVLVDSETSDFWSANLYNLWLSADRMLSPTAELQDPAAAGLSSTFTTEAWGRRLLNTQLASWSELRHDTILYAKQSYTGGVLCEFPDAYVDPYPKFFAALRSYADRGSALLTKLGLPANVASSAQTYFTKLAQVMDTLGGMAEAERTGTPFTADQLAFINQAVHVQYICGGGEFDGWYAQLYMYSGIGLEYDPKIADVHTQPTDEAGNDVGRVLHVGTGMPRLMVVSVDTCQGPRAYAGLASSYFETVTEKYERLTDQVWSAKLLQETPAEVGWMKDLVVR